MRYFSLAYDDILLFVMFSIKLSRNFDGFLTNIKSMLSWYFVTQFLKQSKNSINFDLNQQQHLQTPNYY